MAATTELRKAYAHHTHEMHTVCDWREDMVPTDRVATPIGVLA